MLEMLAFKNSSWWNLVCLKMTSNLNSMREIVDRFFVLLSATIIKYQLTSQKCYKTKLRNVNESDPRSDVHYLGSSENKAPIFFNSRLHLQFKYMTFIYS